MILSTDHGEATKTVQAEEEWFARLTAMAQSKKVGEAGASYLAYFTKTWMSPDLWGSWSTKGRNNAAVMLGIPIEGVLPTTNHLESFNGVLKRKHIANWQRAGRKLRFDVLIFRLITNILPNIYAQHRLLNRFSSWKASRFHAAAGGAHIAPSPSKKKQVAVSLPPITWYEPDPIRDGLAKDFVTLGRVVSIPSRRTFELWATCAATGVAMDDPNYLRYWMTIHPTGSASCTCLDWLKRGGACKHLRAFRILVEHWASRGLLPLVYHYPLTRSEAVDIEEENRVWYGDCYTDAVTMPSLMAGASSAQSIPPSLDFIETRQPLPPLNNTSAAALPSIEQEAELEQGIQELMVPGITIKRPGSDGDNIPIDNNSAIATQIQLKHAHFISKSLPLLHGMLSLLDDGLPSESTEDLDEFLVTLATLQKRLLPGPSTPLVSRPCK